MSYVLVEDIAASWEQYGPIERSIGRSPRGLLLHVAGPTDEGFRIVEVWETEADWRRFEAAHGKAISAVDPVAEPVPVVRDLHAVHVVVGVALQRRAHHEP